MNNENVTFDIEESLEYGNIDNLSLDELENQLQFQLESELSELDFLKEEKEKIGNPDALGKVVMDEVWKQFSNQIGLDMTSETLIQEYDRKHPNETYDEVGKKVLQDSRYKDAIKEMKEQQKNGNLKDGYTGKNLGKNDSANLDHTVSRKEIYENQRRKQANLTTEQLANKKENLVATNESLNKSKGAKNVDQYLKEMQQRKKDLIEENKKANKKIDESNMSDVDKRIAKEKNNKRLKDKLAANEKLMKKADKKARFAIKKDIAINATKQTVKKAGKDALKQMAVSALFALLKDIMNGFIRFLKEKSKSFNKFMEEMKKSIKSFVEKIGSFFKTGTSSFVGTVVSEIFGPVVSLFKKVASLIKQGVASLIDGVKYLLDKKNKNKPFALKVAEVGKIVVAGLAGSLALGLSGVIEGALSTIPIMLTPLPLLGTLANITGMFLASLISGIIGAIVINYIDKFIAEKQKKEIQKKEIEQNNKILITQGQQKIVLETQLEISKENTFTNISERHKEAEKFMKEAYSEIMEDFDYSSFKNNQNDSILLDYINDKTMDDELEKMNKELEELLNSFD